MSAGSNELMSPSKPSIKTKALALAPNVPMPLIQNSAMFFPGSPLPKVDITPATLPPNRLATEAAGCCNWRVSTLVTAAKEEIFRCDPSAVTTTSSSLFSSSLNCISKFFFSSKTRYSTGFMPI